MNLVKFIEILSGKILYLIILPVIAGALTFFMVKDLPSLYSSETTIYTGITTNSGLEVNAQRVDKFVNQNEYSNIIALFKSEAIYEEISLRLLASHLSLSKPQKDIISKDAYNALKSSVPDKVKKLVVKGDEEKTYENLAKSIKQDDKDFLYSMLYRSNPYYSVNALQTLKVEQMNASDMIKLSYKCIDPGICYHTTRIAAQVFIKEYGNLKKNIRSSAVKYFQKKLEETTGKLDNSEGQLLDFNVSNNIINYYEQTKQVTTQNEEIELKLQDAKMNFEATAAVLKKLETEISKRFAINLKNIEIINIRGQLVNCNNDIAKQEMNQGADNKSVKDLYQRKNLLEHKLQSCIDSIYNFDSNSQGIEYQRLLSEWLTAVSNYETYGARFKSMQERREEFAKEYKKYAPLGATTKRIEREIGVRESEYLNILNNLNIALQNEQNIDLLTNMRIIDEAKLPITAEPAKKKMYIIVAVLFTLILYILGVFSVELMDHRVKTPTLLKNLTGWEVLAAFCLHSKKFLNTEQIEHKASLFMYEKIRSMSSGVEAPFVIQLLSNWDGAGKTYTSKSIEQELSKRGYRVKILNFMAAVSGADPEDPASVAAKDAMELYMRANSYRELVGDEVAQLDYIVSVIPSIGRGIDNTVLLKDADLNLVVFNADLPWGNADAFNTNKIKEIIQKPVFSILTNAVPNNLEELYGEIEKKRSKLRKMSKKLLKRFAK
ncbi:MAG: hypothetical protein RIS29_1547 [Bacteroidota bacterium]|jgi:uncharacterized protein involved in exopolysaccharide biosynthesis